MTTAKRKKLKEKEKRARERVRKIKAKRVKAKEKAKMVKVKRKAPKHKAVKIKVTRKYLRHKAKSSDIDKIFEQTILEELLGKKINVTGITAAHLAARTKKRNPDAYYKGTKLIGKTEKEKDQHKHRIDRAKKQTADDAADTRKRNAATKRKLGK